MDNYVPSDESVEEAENPFPDPYRDCKIMTIGKNAKFNNINSYVEKHFQTESNRFVVYKSIDGATDKAISCVEVFKSQSKIPIFQWTKIAFSKRTVLWKCLIDGPRDIRAIIETPVIFIVISKDPFPGEFSCLSMQCSSDREIAFRPAETQPNRRKSEKSTRERNKKPGEENKWTRPGQEQRKKETKERNELLKQIEATSIE